jgi:hypothetical protein
MALFVIPYVCARHCDAGLIALLSLTVIVGWIRDKPLTFLFDPLDSVVLFFTGEAPATLSFAAVLSTDSSSV